MSANPIRVLAADDHPLIRAGLAAMLQNESDMVLVGEATNGEHVLELFRERLPDVVLMDLRMPVMDGLSALTALISEFPDARVIALTTYDGDVDIYRALDAGAKGYLLKDMLRTELLQAIRVVSQGKRFIPPTVAARIAEFTPRIDLTPRETEVLDLVARGLSNQEIAEAIGRTEGTVKVHVKNILAKLGAEDRTQAVTIALERGFIRLGSRA